MTRIFTPGAAALTAALAAPCAAETILPDFDLAVFTPGAPVDNVYFPVLPGPERVYAGENDEGAESFGLSYAGPGPTLLGVQTTTLLDRAYEDGLLVEETRDYYAQDTLGNVWYMGEDVTNYRYDNEGSFLGTDNESAWLAGVNDALPGLIMPAQPVVGFDYFQEFAPDDDALDEAIILALGETVDLDWMTFENVLVTLETTTLDPEAREFKYFAPGYGLIRAEEGLSEAFEDPELIVDLQPPAVPLPPGLPLLAAALAALGSLRRRRPPQTASGKEAGCKASRC